MQKKRFVSLVLWLGLLLFGAACAASPSGVTAEEIGVVFRSPT